MKDESLNIKVISLKVLLFLKGWKHVLTGICQVVKIVAYEGKRAHLKKNLLGWDDFKIFLFLIFF